MFRKLSRKKGGYYRLPRVLLDLPFCFRLDSTLESEKTISMTELHNSVDDNCKMFMTELQISA